MAGNRAKKLPPPRFQKQTPKDYYSDVLEEYGYQEGELFRTTITTEPATKVIDTTVKDPSPMDSVPQRTQEEATNKENMQNVNIVIANTGERKSYSKDRRARDRAVGKTRVQDSVINAVTQGTMHVNVQSSEPSVDSGDTSAKQCE